jgi:hypothetical protein
LQQSLGDIDGVAALRQHLLDLITYLEANRLGLVNYGDRYRRDEPISTAFVESAINEIVSRRMIKKQQMRWNRWTVQPFLDVRVAVLDGTLERSFRQLYPKFRPANDLVLIGAAASTPHSFECSPFVLRPHRRLLSPIAVLQLLSMRLDTRAVSMPIPKRTPHHHIAELFLPSRSERALEHPLLPALWTAQHPIRLVTPRGPSCSQQWPVPGRAQGSLRPDRRRTRLATTQCRRAELNNQPGHSVRILKGSSQGN